LFYAEAIDTLQRMAAAGGLTRLDRDSEVRLIDDGKARYCAGSATQRPAYPDPAFIGP
jgi:protein involved in polysaccharide export with SLBB domain